MPVTFIGQYFRNLGYLERSCSDDKHLTHPSFLHTPNVSMQCSLNSKDSPSHVFNHSKIINEALIRNSKDWFPVGVFSEALGNQSYKNVPAKNAYWNCLISEYFCDSPLYCLPSYRNFLNSEEFFTLQNGASKKVILNADKENGRSLNERHPARCNAFADIASNEKLECLNKRNFNVFDKGTESIQRRSSATKETNDFLMAVIPEVQQAPFIKDVIRDFNNPNILSKSGPVSHFVHGILSTNQIPNIPEQNYFMSTTSVPTMIKTYDSSSSHFEIKENKIRNINEFPLWDFLFSRKKIRKHGHRLETAFKPQINSGDKIRQKRNVLRDMARPLKQWLIRHRHHPYPSRAEKLTLALKSRMTLIQVSNWFANARRRLKNAVKEPCGWGQKVKMYNSQISGNAELLSISSDDTIWESNDEDDKIINHGYINSSSSIAEDHSYVNLKHNIFVKEKSPIKICPTKSLFSCASSKYKRKILEKYLDDSQRERCKIEKFS